MSEKNGSTYAGILRRHAIAPGSFLMTGNSLKSDILPVLALGSAAAYVPYPLTWAAEHVAEVPPAGDRFFPLKNLRDLPAVIAGWSSAA